MGKTGGYKQKDSAFNMGRSFSIDSGKAPTFKPI